MSKKKATMTLKDFHGGSIPSDLPLPSAPGVTVRPMDRPVFDRPSPWGNPMGRPDHRLRPGSAGSLKNNFDDKSPFLAPNIGRYFDEDERKPLDGGSGPRRPAIEDSFHADVAKPNFPASFSKPPSQQFSSSGPSSGPSSYAGRVSDPGHGSYPNAWAVRKEPVAEVSHAVWSGPTAAAKLAHASALDKVSSGRWQSNKLPIHQLGNIENVKNSEIENIGGGVVYEDVRNLTINNDKFDNISHGGKFIGSVTPVVAPLEQLERPKLKLLPRSKPLDSSEPPIDNNQGYDQLQNLDHVHKISESYETATVIKSGLTVADSGDLAVDRPKLKLKPRSQGLERVEESAEKGRNTVFGGARPRELVLKERGIDDIVVNNHDVVHPPNRVKQDLPKTEPISPNVIPSRYNGKPEANPPDINRTRKNNDTRDNRVNTEKTDIQKRNNNNWRSENQRIQPHHQPPQERPPSPDTWRKPIEEPRPVSSDGPTGLRYGKAASAVELAQAFSKSVSDPKTVDRFPNQRGGGGSQTPFSRLTDPGSRPQINGY